MNNVLCENDQKILDELLKLNVTIYRVYKTKMENADRSYILSLSNNSTLNTLFSKEKELLESLNLDEKKAKEVIRLCDNRIDKFASQADALLDDDASNMAFRRLKNTVTSYINSSKLKDLYKDNAVTMYEYFELLDGYDDEDLTEEERQELEESIAICSDEMDYCKRGASLLVKEQLKGDTLSLLVLLLDDEIGMCKNSEMEKYLQKVKYNIIYLNSNLEMGYTSLSKVNTYNLAYLCAHLFAMRDEEYNSIQNEHGLYLCEVFLNELLSNGPIDDLNTTYEKVRALLQTLLIRIGMINLDDHLLIFYEDVLKNIIVNYYMSNKENEREISSIMRGVLGMHINYLPEKDDTDESVIKSLKDAIIFNSSDRARYRNN